jgi:glycosyltransferase involved in cell wall biosynthesis
MNTINLVYNGYTNPNGAITFAYHLYKILSKSYNVNMYRASKNPSRKKPFSINDIPCEDIGFDMLKRLTRRYSMVVQEYGNCNETDLADFEESAKGMLLLVHDYRSESLAAAKKFYANDSKIIVIRESMNNMLKSMGIKSYTFPFPYTRSKNNYTKTAKSRLAICISRISGDKNTDIVAEANKSPELKHKIKFLGPITSPIYEFRKMRVVDSKWKDNWLGPAANSIDTMEYLKESEYMVDMSFYKKENNNGELQYTILEALECNTIPILHFGWLGDGSGIMRSGYNCLGAGDASDIVNILNSKIRVSKEAMLYTIQNQIDISTATWPILFSGGLP